jgi:hypothetical protein
MAFYEFIFPLDGRVKDTRRLRGVSLLTYHAAIGLYNCLRMQFCQWRPITSIAIT